MIRLLDLSIPQIGPDAGFDGDGVVRGRINQSDPVAALYGTVLVPIAQVLRKDVTTTGATWADVTTAATDAVSGDFQPWGTAPSMSNGDAFYVRTQNDRDTHAFYVQIATPGVGAWNLEVQEWDTSLGTWVAVTGLQDDSTAFRAAAGVHRISYTSGPEGSVRLDDTQPAYIWHRFALSGFSSASAAPVLSRLWSADAAVSLSNVTASHTSSPADFSSLPAEELPVIDNYCIFVHPGPPVGRDTTIHRPRSANYTVVYEYLASDGTWKAIPNLSDPSNGESAALVNSQPTTHRVRWSLPSDWVSQSITDAASTTHTGWIERCRINAVTVEGPVAPPQAQSESRSLGTGNASGIHHPAAKTYSAVTYDIGIPPSTAMTLQFTNAATAASQAVTIPANSASSAHLANVRLDFAASLSIGAGQSLIVSHVGGGSASDVELRLA